MEQMNYQPNPQASQMAPQPNAAPVQTYVQTAPTQQPSVPPNVEEWRTTVRMQEESKVRGQLDSLRMRAEQAESRANSVTSQVEILQKEINELKSAAAENNKKAETPSVDLSAEINKIRADIVKEFKDQITSLKNQLDEARNQEQEARRQADISNYAAQKIAAANGAVVPELVTGSTVEEIDASFDRAVEVYNRYNPPGANAALTDNQVPSQNTAPQVIAPGSGGQPSSANPSNIPGDGHNSEEVSLENELNEMSYHEYAKGDTRERVMKTLKKTLPRLTAAKR